MTHNNQKSHLKNLLKEFADNIKSIDAEDSIWDTRHIASVIKMYNVKYKAMRQEKGHEILNQIK